MALKYLLTVACVFMILIEQDQGFPFQPNTTPGPTDPNASFCTGRPDGLYPNPSNSATFFQCSNGNTYIQPCPAGLVYDDTCKCCNWPNAGPVSSLVPESLPSIPPLQPLPEAPKQEISMKCTQVSGSLKQIDAGLGLVFGVNVHDSIYALFGKSWTQLPGALKHVSVGPAGVWGVNSGNNIYKLVGADWVQVPGQLTQVDAGGDQFVAGVNHIDNVYCMNRDPAVDFRSTGSPAPWNQLTGALEYHSCGPIGCWGVNKKQDIYMREAVTPTGCENAVDWKYISGKLVMVEVGTDGSVYGVNAGGDVYRRDGITASAPAGTDWTFISECGKSKHVSYDLGHLWVITPDEKILDCVV